MGNFNSPISNNQNVSSSYKNGENSGLMVDAYQNLKVSIQSPTSPSHEIIVTDAIPRDQVHFGYGVNPDDFKIFNGFGGGYVATSSMLQLTTSSDLFSFVAMRSKKTVRYSPGQAIVMRFSALFSDPVTSSLMFVGCGHGEDGFFVGYNGTQFGLMHRNAGRFQLQKFTIISGSSTNENIAVTLDGATYSASVTNTGDAEKTAFEIANSGTFNSFWSTTAVANEVYFLQTLGAPAAKTGEFSLSGTTMTSSFSIFRSASAPEENWYYQTEWNMDKCDGTGKSLFNLDHKKGNVYQIMLQYLGFANITLFVKDRGGELIPVHYIDCNNNNDKPSVSDPAFPSLVAAASLGAQTPISASFGSLGLFTVGSALAVFPTNAESYYNASIGTSYENILSVRNTNYRNNQINRMSMKLLNVSAAAIGTKTVLFQIVKNPIYSQTPIFRNQFPSSSFNTVDICKDEILVIGGQILAQFTLGAGGNINKDLTDFNFYIERGESVAVVARTTGATSEVAATLVWHEDR